MPSETDVAPKTLSGWEGWDWKSLGRAIQRAPSLLIISREDFIPFRMKWYLYVLSLSGQFLVVWPSSALSRLFQKRRFSKLSVNLFGEFFWDKYDLDLKQWGVFWEKNSPCQLKMLIFSLETFLSPEDISFHIIYTFFMWQTQLFKIDYFYTLSIHTSHSNQPAKFWFDNFLTISAPCKLKVWLSCLWMKIQALISFALSPVSALFPFTPASPICLQSFPADLHWYLSKSQL